MYELTVERDFAAAHHLRGYQGRCARPHGHNYRVQVSVVGQELNQQDLLMDFGQLKATCDEVIAELDHTDLNQHPVFVDANPSTENLAQYIFTQVAARLNQSPVQVAAVSVWESDTARVTYTED